jgi:predicted dehydrogenase
MLRLGIIGTGGMAHSHARAFAAMPGVRLTACCDVAEEKARDFAREWGIPRWYAEHSRMLEEERLDGVSVVTVDAMHAPITLAALSRGIPVLCEKPLATSLADARRMRDAAARRGAPAMVNFSYRDAFGAQAAAELVRGGGIGRVMHVEASYLQSWLAQDAWGDWRGDPKWTWRLSRRHGSGGVLGDVGCHIYDMAAFLCGEITEITCRLAVFDKGVEGGRIGPYRLDANDSFVSTVRFAGGGMGSIHASRWATGHVNSVRVQVHGEGGAVEVDLDRGRDRYWICRGAKALRAGAWREVRARPTPSQYARFVRWIRTGSADPSDFRNGARVQGYLAASEESDRERRPVKVRAGA